MTELIKFEITIMAMLETQQALLLYQAVHSRPPDDFIDTVSIITAVIIYNKVIIYNDCDNL